MKVINETDWTTASLKAILQRCAEQEFDDGHRRKRLVVTVKYTRGGGCSGYAWRKSSHSVVRIEAPQRRRSTQVFIPEAEAKKRGNYFTETMPGQGTRYYIHKYVARAHTAQELRDLALMFASVACHEFAHNRGMKHAQMPGYYQWRGKWRDYVAWAADLPLVAKPKQVKVRVGFDQKLTRAQAGFKKAQTRAKRAATLLAKWRRKVKYYETRAAAARKEPRGGDVPDQ